MGTAAGWLYYVGMLALGEGILPMIGGRIHDTIQGEFNRSPLPNIVWNLLLFILVESIIYLSVALSTRVQLALALISVTVVLIFSIFVIIKSAGLHHGERVFALRRQWASVIPVTNKAAHRSGVVMINVTA